MRAPAVESAVHELMDLDWNVVYDLLEVRGLLEARVVRRGVHRHPLLAGRTTHYTFVQSRDVAVLFLGTGPVDATPFHRLLGADDRAGFFSLPR